ncbi:hypothetical protein F961_03149 [Acinetobacter baumannii NIPH 60]|nr:hypothetical protein F961_03149 [Acinetobacter baumannii NIPH 60]
MTTVEIGFHPHGGGLAADLALFSVHVDAPVKIDLTRHRRSRYLISFCFLRKTRCPASAVDRDRAPLLGRTGLALFHRDHEHAVLKSGLDRVLVSIGRQVQSALKAAVGALHPVETAVFRFLLLTLFTAHQQHVVVERDLDVFFLDAGYFQGNLVLLVGLLDVQRRLQHARPVRRPAWHGGQRAELPSRRCGSRSRVGSKHFRCPRQRIVSTQKKIIQYRLFVQYGLLCNLSVNCSKHNRPLAKVKKRLYSSHEI